MFPLKRLDEIKQHPQDFLLLQRVPLTREDVLVKLPIQLVEIKAGENIIPMVFIALETNGPSIYSHKIIELALLRCTFSLDRQCFISIDQIYDEYEDPKENLSENVTALSGISSDMIKNKCFNDELIINFMADKPLVISHHAVFDRPFFEKRFPSLIKLAWACSQSEIDWRIFGSHIFQLEYLLKDRMFFFEANRAINNCLALFYLLQIEPKALNMLYISSLQSHYIIEAYGAPFHCKDELKSHHYHFNSDKKVWYIKSNNTKSALEEVNFLSTLYKDAPQKVKIITFSAFDRYRH